MRHLLVIVVLAGLAGCNSAQSAKNAANEEYAVDSYEQSLKAYQLCAEANPGDPRKCSALARVMEADKARFNKQTSRL